MRNRNNITPKNSSQMLLSGKDNVINPNLKTGAIIGNGNRIGNGENITVIGSSGNIVESGFENIVLINSFDCEVGPGLHNIVLNNSSGVIVTDSNVTYQGSALITIPPSTGIISPIYEATIDIPSADVLNLDFSPFELISAPPSGYYIKVIHVSGYLIYGGINYVHAGILEVLLAGCNPTHYFENAFLTSSGIRSRGFDTAPGGGLDDYLPGVGLYLNATSANPTTGNSDLRIYLTYQIIQE